MYLLASSAMFQTAAVARRKSAFSSAASIVAGYVIAQRVPPDVHDLAGVAGDSDAPAAGAGGRPRGGEVAQAGGDERQDFVAAFRGLDA